MSKLKFKHAAPCLGSSNLFIFGKVLKSLGICNEGGSCSSEPQDLVTVPSYNCTIVQLYILIVSWIM